MAAIRRAASYNFVSCVVHSRNEDLLRTEGAHAAMRARIIATAPDSNRRCLRNAAIAAVWSPCRMAACLDDGVNEYGIAGLNAMRNKGIAQMPDSLPMPDSYGWAVAIEGLKGCDIVVPL